MYFDLQVNGYAGVDFNADDLSAEQMLHACRRLNEDGVIGCLATIITADLDSMCRRLDNLCRVREKSTEIADMIFGIHIEGPFLSNEPGYVGAHPRLAVCQADISSMQRLLEAAHGLTKLVTLAPERDTKSAVTRLLADAGIRVSAGHCNPNYDTLAASIDAGLTMFTHLGNGCPLTLHRHENIIHRALSKSDRLAIGFIADGIHIPYPALANYLAVTGFDRAFIVTDAIAAAGCGPGQFTLGDQPVIVDEQFATWSASGQNLVGSACTMPVVVDRLRNSVGLTGTQIAKLTVLNPCQLMGRAPVA